MRRSSSVRTRSDTALTTSAPSLLPPKEMTGFRYLMIWHPRLHKDAAHTWLRSIVGRRRQSADGE